MAQRDGAPRVRCIIRPFLDVTTRWDAELGLLGLAFHPQYKTNGIFFIACSNLDGDMVIARYEVDDAGEVYTLDLHAGITYHLTAK